ncbi:MULTISPECIES: hypothetical protein [Vibrio]|uniref:hypothetical protein n=1 Tax=Vibrio TaxID=662 RepID=UPI00084B8A3B|nr:MULTISPECIES: hypothetical protein [Vibrio]MBD1567538.1 hypothetical protein [Vibrio sp. S12_S33]OEA24929.1 hypothetical protein BBM55_02665 [Vibrio parahaemolyticus]
MIWIKRLVLITLLSVMGYFLFLHAGMASDGAIELEWYYRFEMIAAGIIWWPAVLYLKFRELANYPTNILGLELWPVQYLSYCIAFKLYDLMLENKKTTNK